MADDKTMRTAPSFTVTINDGAATAKPAEAVPEPSSRDCTWKGKGSQSIKYTATAEMLPLHEDGGTLIGHMFALSYVTDAQDKTDRPVTFCWNGGPGGSSAMVNIGGMGPRRVPISSQEQLPCPTQPEDNPYSILPDSDLVFLDAMGTGYSKIAEGYDAKKVWGVDGDADAFMRGIAQWLTTHDRWNAPLYLYGESYGTMRNSVLMRVLGERGIAVTGVIEQSTILDYAPTLPGNDLYYMGMLPVYAATANHFGKAGKGVDQFEWFNKAWQFVDERYSQALIKSDTISEREERQVAREMSKLIGLPADVIQQKHLRIELDTFRKMIVADEGLFIGRYDTRFTEAAYMDVQGDNEFFAGEDPSGDAIMTPDESAWMKLVQETGFKGSPLNILLSFKVNEDWNWTHQAPGTMGSPVCPNTAYDMATALRRNPKCRVLFFGGIHDAATPFWNVKHAMSKMFLPDYLKERIEYHVHENGHMAYEDYPTLQQMAPELHAFYEKRHED